jgi:7-cyano-7-deazaguanine synthase
MRAAVVLVSGGLDSAVCLKKAVDEGIARLALTFDYGQKAAEREIEAAKKICGLYDVTHRVIKLEWLKKLTSTALVNPDKDVPTVGYMAGVKRLKQAAKMVWVPNRNALFVNIAACFAEALGYDAVVAGFNREEALFFPDNSIQFIASINSCLQLSTLRGIVLHSYTAHLTKKEVGNLAKRIGVPLDMLWSCYLGGPNPCGRCQSCVNFEIAVGRIL